MGLDSQFYFALFIGVVFSLIYAETTGILPAGMVVPGYLALIFNQPALLIAIFLVSFATYFVVVYGVSKLVIIYGRRKFVAMIMVGMTIKVVMDIYVPLAPIQMGTLELAEMHGIGYIVPGLIANTIERQGFSYTSFSALLVAALTVVAMIAYESLMF